MFDGLMRRLSADGVELKGIRGVWERGANSVDYEEYMGFRKFAWSPEEAANHPGAHVFGWTPEEAATHTWTGRAAAQYGFTEVEVQELGNIKAIFRKPK